MFRFTYLNSIKNKLFLARTISFVLIITAFYIYYAYSVSKKANELARQSVLESATNFAGKLKSEIEAALTASRAMSQALSSVAAQNNSLNVDRNQVNSFLRMLLLQNKKYVSTFSVWEPNSFDNTDKNFAGISGNDKDGRFIPFWYKDTLDNAVLSSMKYYETSGIGNYYQIPKKTLTEFVTDPYSYPVRGNQIFQVSAVSPITYNNIFYGVTGINIECSSIQKLVANTKLFGDESELYVLSNDGTYLGAWPNDSAIGKNLQDFHQNYRELLSEIQNGQSFVRSSGNSIEAVAPVHFGNSPNTWQVKLRVPADALLADTHYQLWMTAFFAILLLTIIIVMGNKFIKKTLQPLHQLAEVTEQLALGNLEIEVQPAKEMEIQKIGASLLKLNMFLQNIASSAKEIAHGNLDKPLEVQSPKDELSHSINLMIASLQKEKEETEASRKEVAIRNWSRQGLAELSQIMSLNYTKIEDLTAEIIKNIINYLNAAQGGIFILNDTLSQDIHLELTASIAYDRRKYIDKKIYPGENLVGTCYLEKQTIYLKKIPENYIEITSGLGAGKPRSLLLVPLKIENQVLGVFEISSFYEFLPHEIEFIEKVSENIAISLSTAKINKRNQILLEKFQVQAEELSLREEAMRLNFEELQSTQEESDARAAEMQSVLNILEESYLVAEINMTGEIIKITPAYAQLLGYQPEEIIGKKYREFRLLKYDTTEFKNLLNELKENRKQQIEENIEDLSGKNIWFSSVYAPILDRNGVPYKIIDISMDLTERKKQEIYYKNQTEEFEKQAIEIKLASIENHSLLKAIDESLMAGEYATDGTILRLNENYIELTGFSYEDLKNKNLFDFLKDTEKEQFLRIWQVLLNGTSYRMLVTRLNKSGQKVWVEATYIPVRDFNNKIYKIFVIGTNVTQYYIKEQESIKKLEELNNKLTNLTK
jgi:methyl-accepting chemotaxis protein